MAAKTMPKAVMKRGSKALEVLVGTCVEHTPKHQSEIHFAPIRARRIEAYSSFLSSRGRSLRFPHATRWQR
jgi:hypothetical protein